MDQQEEPRWQPTRRQLLWAGATVGPVLLTIAVLIGYRYGITLWDWIKLLIVPTTIAGAGFWFNTQQREREQRIADNRAQDDSLQAYLDGMSQLLTDKDLPLYSAQPGDSLSTVARARTLTVLGRLDGGRKRSVLQFLYESGLIDNERILLDEAGLIERRHNIISLYQAPLTEAFLSGAGLSGANLIGANLIGANLSEANLFEAFLSRANLSRANLSRADLSGAGLSRANLSRANLSGADLSEAFLWGANLSVADLSGADLSVADLRSADLSGAQGVTNEQLSAAYSLEGATMPGGQTLRGDKNPNGPTFEDWLKGKGREEDEKNE